MKKYLLLIFLLTVKFSAFSDVSGENGNKDTSEVALLNKQAFSLRLNSPTQTISYANKALALALKLDYKAGMAESYRILGIANYYLNDPRTATSYYLNSLDLYEQLKDIKGQARVYNNIGSLHRDNNYDAALSNFQKSLAIGKKLSDQHIIAAADLNIGDIYNKLKKYDLALKYTNESGVLFEQLNDKDNVITSLQNKGVIYFHLHKLDTAEQLLVEAKNKAKERNSNETVASINLTIASIYIAQEKYKEAEEIIREGLDFSEKINDEKIMSDYKYTRYQMEFNRKNYQKALNYLVDIYHKDSLLIKQNTSNQIVLIQEQVKQNESRRQNELLRQRQQYDLIKFWGVVVVAVLLLVLVSLLVSNVKRKAKTNTQLTELNAEVSRQKEDLDRINHHLEEIIDERTKDLQEKNIKLSEYSSYLSHQIRGPVATLKGLMNLEKEGLIDHADCIMMMNKCVSEIDIKIIEISDMLHDPEETA